MNRSVFGAIILGLLTFPVLIGAGGSFEPNVMVGNVGMAEHSVCKRNRINDIRMQQQTFQYAVNKICCCETFDGSVCCGYAAQCGGPIPGCDCK